jgi:hypothetical protein
MARRAMNKALAMAKFPILMISSQKLAQLGQARKSGDFLTSLPKGLELWVETVHVY